MGYNLKTWKDRIAQRTDLSTQIVHLTRDREDTNLVEVMYEIINSKKIIGSSTNSGFICGDQKAVCFQDAPLVSVCQNVYYEQKYKEKNPLAKTRYKACGLSFSKNYAFNKGARPVIYDRTADAKTYLPKDQWWRIVNFDLSSADNLIDWTHEREWRMAGDFIFDISEATLLFVNDVTYKNFKNLCTKNEVNYMDQVKGIVVMNNLLF